MNYVNSQAYNYKHITMLRPGFTDGANPMPGLGLS